jgi:hypothetical protein
LKVGKTLQLLTTKCGDHEDYYYMESLECDIEKLHGHYHKTAVAMVATWPDRTSADTVAGTSTGFSLSIIIFCVALSYYLVVLKCWYR